MKRLDSRSHWQKIYAEKEPTDLSWFQAEPVVSLELITNCKLKHTDPVIDIGGGASVLIDHLLQRGFSQVTVIDISANALSASRQRLGAKADSVDWVESDIIDYRPQHRFVLWHDRAVFHFLTNPIDRRKYVNTLKQGLQKGGHLILATFAIGGPDKCSGLPVVQYDTQKIQAALGSEFTLVEERNENHMTPAQEIQKFSYFHLLRENGLKI